MFVLATPPKKERKQCPKCFKDFGGSQAHAVCIFFPLCFFLGHGLCLFILRGRESHHLGSQEGKKGFSIPLFSPCPLRSAAEFPSTIAYSLLWAFFFVCFVLNQECVPSGKCSCRSTCKEFFHAMRYLMT